MELFVLFTLFGLFLWKLNKILHVDYQKDIKGSRGKCTDCGVTVGIRYYGSGRPLCQFCDDKSMETNNV